MHGILRNENSAHPNEESSFDRAKVLSNTEQNAQIGEEGQLLREKLRHEKRANQSGRGELPKTKAPSALKDGEMAEDNGFTGSGGVEFDEKEIQDWDQQRGQTEKIMEPNTPYMGTAKDTEYYDDEEPVPEDLDLGDHQ